MKRQGIHPGARCLKGFTLVEMLIAMALTALIVMFGMAVISHFILVFHSVQRTNDDQSSVVQLYRLLKRDIDRADQVTWDESLHCVHPLSEVGYYFDKEQVIRQSGEQIDTFHIRSQVNDIGWFQNTGLVNRLAIDLFNRELVFPVTIVKQYSSGLIPEKK